MTTDFYSLLEVTSDASQEEIKQAFRERVQEYHPDLNDDPRAPAQFTALKKGYDTLSDPVERKAYDRLGHEDYVAKRLEGLPDPEQWAPREQSDDDALGSGRGAESSRRAGRSRSSDAGRTGATRRDASRHAGDADRTGSRTGGRTGADSGRTGADATGEDGTRTSDSGGAHAADRTSERAGAADGGTADPAASASRAGSSSAGSGGAVRDAGVAGWFRTVNLGWPLVFAVVAVYAVGVGGFVRANAGGFRTLWRAALDAGGPHEVLRVLREGRRGADTLLEFVVAAPGGSDVRLALAALVAVGVVSLPAVFLVVVRRTRRGYGWRPSYLYVVAVAAPLAGLGLTALGVDWPVVDVVCYLLLPATAVLALLFSAFVRPRIAAALGRS